MTSIPGIDDYDEEEYHLESLHSDCKRPLSPDVKQENRKKFHADYDEDDRLLYGDDELAVSDMTLINRKLPAKEVDFVVSILSKREECQEQQIRETYSKVNQVQVIETTNVFEVTFVSHLWLEARKMLSRTKKCEQITFYPFFKYKTGDLLFLSCFCPISTSHESQEASAKNERVSLFTTGQLVSVRIIPVDDSIRSLDIFGYIHEQGRRMPDNSMRLEVDVRSRYNHSSGKTIMHDIILMIPSTDENRQLWENSKYYLKLAPITSISGIFTQVRAVYGIGRNPLFRHFLGKDFTLSPTGTLITSDVDKFNPQQLEAIQRAFDLVIQPGNPCKAVLVDGHPVNVCATVIEIINQILTNDLTKGHQYIVTSSETRLIFLIKKLKKLLPDLMKSKLILFAGHDDERITHHAEKCMRGEIENLEKSSPTDHSNKKVACLKKCLSALQSKNGLSNCDADVLMTVDSYKNHSLVKYLERAQLIFGTVNDFSRLPEFHEHLQSKKVLPCVTDAHPDPRSHVPLSCCVIADAGTLTDPELMAFSSEEEFQFRRFILTSGWMPREESEVKLQQKSIHQSLCDRLKCISATADSPLVVDVGHDVPL